MKAIFTFLVLFVLCILQTKAQSDSTITTKFQTTYLGDGFQNFAGGIQKGASYLGLANFKMSIEINKLGFWSGGQFSINLANTHGDLPSKSLICDLQASSNIEAGEHSYIHEFWYKQSFQKWNFVIGLQDLNTDFVSSQFAALFNNSSFGTPSTIASNLPVPIFPLTAIGISFSFQLTPLMTTRLAFFDGLPEDLVSNIYNTHWDLKNNEGVLSFGEINYQTIANSLNSNIRLGAYYHTNIPNFSSDEVLNLNENYGAYLIIDQEIFKNGNQNSFSMFCQASVSPFTINENWYYLGLGFNYKGLFSKQNNDVLGFAIANAGLKDRDDEICLEFTYKRMLNDHFFVQPDLQYIIHPSGSGAQLEDDFMGLIRFGINF